MKRLAELLEAIEIADTDYDRRYGLILEALAVAHSLGMPAGLGYDKNSGPDFDGFRAVVYIQLDTGQVSWHMPEFFEWDGHTTEQKYERVAAYVALKRGDAS